MKDEELVGRIVGYDMPYLRDLSQVAEGESEIGHLTEWARVRWVHPDCPGLCGIESIHTKDAAGRAILRDRFHTVMPEGYNG